MPAVWLLIVTTILGCFAPESKARSSEAKQAVLTPTVYVIQHRFHTGFAVHRKFLDKNRLGKVLDEFRGYQYLEIGWGDKEFYMASGDNYWLAVRALLWPTDTTMHVVGFNRLPQERFAYSEIVAIPLTEDKLAELNSFIADSFASFESLRVGLYGPSYFYPGTGSFHLFRTCNVWTAEGLAAAKLDISPAFSFTARSVLDQSAKVGKVIRSEDEAEALAH